MTDQLEKYGYLPLLATGARAAGSNGTCALCRRRFWRGRDRIATLPGDGESHILCVARAAQAHPLPREP